MSSDYISLQEAAKYCGYTPEYLNLRARQGRLKAVKFARNWLTKKEWLQEYLDNANGNNNNNNLITEQRTELKPRYKLHFKPALVFTTALAMLISGVALGYVGKEDLKNAFGKTQFLAEQFANEAEKGLAQITETTQQTLTETGLRAKTILAKTQNTLKTLRGGGL